MTIQEQVQKALGDTSDPIKQKVALYVLLDLIADLGWGVLPDEILEQYLERLSSQREKTEEAYLDYVMSLEPEEVKWS